MVLVMRYQFTSFDFIGVEPYEDVGDLASWDQTMQCIQRKRPGVALPGRFDCCTVNKIHPLRSLSLYAFFFVFFHLFVPIFFHHQLFDRPAFLIQSETVQDIVHNLINHRNDNQREEQ